MHIVFGDGSVMWLDLRLWPHRRASPAAERPPGAAQAAVCGVACVGAGARGLAGFPGRVAPPNERWPNAQGVQSAVPLCPGAGVREPSSG